MINNEKINLNIKYIRLNYYITIKSPYNKNNILNILNITDYKNKNGQRIHKTENKTKNYREINLTVIEFFEIIK